MSMKKSDLKQREKAQQKFYKSMRDYMYALDDLKGMDEMEISVDDYNKLSTGIDKMTKIVTRITEKAVYENDNGIF